MKKTVFITLIAASLAFPCRAGVDILDYLNNNPALRGAYVGVCAVTLDGDTLAFHNGNGLFVPASNMKLVTTASAISSLGADYRYRTCIAVSGEVRDSVLYGNVFIVGGGDPTIAYPGSPEKVFTSWMNMLSAAGIRKIEGKVVGDGGFFPGMKEHPTWELADTGTYYGTGTSGLQFAGNTLNFKVAPGQCPGDSIAVEQSFPATPWMNFSYDCTTGEKGTGDQLYLYTADYSENAVLRGTYACGKKPKVVGCSNKFPELTCAREFALFLESHGISADGFAAGATPEDAVKLGETLSAPLREIIVPLNKDSDNFLAETVFRTMGRELAGDAGYDSCTRVEKSVLDSIGVSGDGNFVIVDGSGLSSKDFISPAIICRILRHMLEKDSSGAFLNSLPRAGIDGTVSSFLPGLPDEVRHSFHLKSGSMGGVRAYSGYYLPKNGTPVIFSVIINNSSASASRLVTAAGEIISSIILSESSCK